MTRLTGADRAAARLDAVARYADGQTVARIAHETGRSPGAVYHLLHEAGVTLRSSAPGGDRDTARQKAAEAYGELHSIRKVAALLGISFGYTRTLLIEEGVALGPRGYQPGYRHGKATR